MVVGDVGDRITHDVRDVAIGNLVVHLASVAGRRDDADVTQRCEVLRREWLREAGRLNELRHRLRATLESDDEAQARRSAERLEEARRAFKSRVSGRYTAATSSRSMRSLMPRRSSRSVSRKVIGVAARNSAH